MVIYRVVKIWSARRRGSAGSQLHVRLAQLFGLISVAPAIIVAVFSALFFNFGLESWFSDTVRTALKESEAVASAYLEEHKRISLPMGYGWHATSTTKHLNYNSIRSV